MENRLLAAVKKQIEKVDYFCNVENTSPNLAVHEIRKSFKRIRALFYFFSERPDLNLDQNILEIKNLGKLISPLRESFVNMQVFERIAENKIINDKKIREIKEFLLEKNRNLLFNWKEGEKYQNTFKNFIEDFNVLLKSDKIEISDLQQIETALLNIYTNGYKLYQIIEVSSDGEQWHNLRKILKRLWYQIDFILFLHPRYFRLKIVQLHTITELLGEEHDLYILSLEIKNENFGLDSDEEIVLVNKIQHLREIIQLKLSTRMKQFFNDTPENFEFKLNKIFSEKNE